MSTLYPNRISITDAYTDYTAMTNHPSLPSPSPPPGDAGRAQGHGGAVRHQDPEEGRGDPGRRRGVHHGGEEGAGPVREATLPHPFALLLPDHGRDDPPLSLKQGPPPQTKPVTQTCSHP